MYSYSKNDQDKRQHPALTPEGHHPLQRRTKESRARAISNAAYRALTNHALANPNIFAHFQEHPAGHPLPQAT